MLLGIENNVNTIAFPNISTGIYKFPKKIAAKIAIKTIQNFESKELIKEVIFVCFDNENFQLYRKILEY